MIFLPSRFLRASRFCLSNKLAYSRALTATKAVHAPHKGAVQALTGLGFGEVDFMATDLFSAPVLLKNGKPRALAITTLLRLPARPNIPMVDEEGVSGYEIAACGAAFAGAGTPAYRIAMLNALFRSAMNIERVTR